MEAFLGGQLNIAESSACSAGNFVWKTLWMSRQVEESEIVALYLLRMLMVFGVVGISAPFLLNAIDF